jgi:TM2 domain-containing membrane protein YozV
MAETSEVHNKKIVAGILAIVLGSLAIHKFYLGLPSAVIHLLVGIFTCGFAGSVIGIIEGIIYLTKSDEDFERTYLVEKKGWF